MADRVIWHSTDQTITRDAEGRERVRSQPTARAGATVTPEQFGAIGDGITDDTDAVQEALDYAGRVRGTVRFTAEAYAVAPTQIITADNGGSGRHCLIPRSRTTLDLGRSTLRQLPTAETTIDPDIATSLIRLHRVDDVRIIGGTLIGDRVARGVPDGNSDGSNSGLVEMFCSTNITVDGVTLRDSTGDGVSASDLSRRLASVKATEGDPTVWCPIASRNSYMMQVLETGGALVVSSPLFPPGSHVSSTDRAARTVTMSAPALVTGEGDVILWRSQRQNITVSDCRADNNRRNAVTIESGRGITIRNCTLVNTNGASPESGIDVEPYYGMDFLQDVTIEGCHTSGNRMAGMYVQNVRDVRVRGNDIHDGLTLRGTADCHISGNSIRAGITLKRSGAVITANKIIDAGVAIYNETGTEHRLPLDVELIGNSLASALPDVVGVTIFNTGTDPNVYRNLVIRANTFRVDSGDLKRALLTNSSPAPVFETVEVSGNLFHIEAASWARGRGLVFDTFPHAPRSVISSNTILLSVAVRLLAGAKVASLLGDAVTFSGNTITTGSVPAVLLVGAGEYGIHRNTYSGTAPTFISREDDATIRAAGNIAEGVTALAQPGDLATESGNVTIPAPTTP